MNRLDGKPRNMPRPNCRPGEKRCGTCKLWKELDEFYNSAGAHDGKGTRCKPCDKDARRKHYEENYDRDKARWRAIKNAHGLTEEQWMSMYNEQNGTCAICDRSQEDRGYADRCLSVDHDHESGVVRGLLCNGCNRALGFFEDKPELLRAAAKYLEEESK